jgi:hypothetical protein
VVARQTHVELLEARIATTPSLAHAAAIRWRVEALAAPFSRARHLAPAGDRSTSIDVSPHNVGHQATPGIRN